MYAIYKQRKAASLQMNITGQANFIAVPGMALRSKCGQNLCQTYYSELTAAIEGRI